MRLSPYGGDYCRYALHSCAFPSLLPVGVLSQRGNGQRLKNTRLEQDLNPSGFLNRNDIRLKVERKGGLDEDI